MVKPVIRPSNIAASAVHVDVELDALADPQVGQLGFLEIGVDPDFGQRTDGHQALAGLHVVAGVDVAPRDHAADLGIDVAIAQIQFGLVEIGSACSQLGFGLP